MTCPFCLFNFYFFHYRPSGIHFFHIFTNLYFFICTHSYIICLLSRQFLNYFLHSCTFRYSCCFYGFCKFLIFCILYLISACLFRLLFPCCCEALLTGFYRFKSSLPLVPDLVSALDLVSAPDLVSVPDSVSVPGLVTALLPLPSRIP